MNYILGFAWMIMAIAVFAGHHLNQFTAGVACLVTGYYFYQQTK